MSLKVIREINGIKVEQRESDGFYEANDVLPQWNKNHTAMRRRKLYDFLDLKSTAVLIGEIKSHGRKNAHGDYQSLSQVDANVIENGNTVNPVVGIKSYAEKNRHGDFQVVKYVKGKDTKDGRTPDKVWMHPYLFTDFLMWLDVDFRYEALRLVYSTLIEDKYLRIVEDIVNFLRKQYIRKQRGNR